MIVEQRVQSGQAPKIVVDAFHMWREITEGDT